MSVSATPDQLIQLSQLLLQQLPQNQAETPEGQPVSATGSNIPVSANTAGTSSSEDVVVNVPSDHQMSGPTASVSGSVIGGLNPGGFVSSSGHVAPSVASQISAGAPNPSSLYSPRFVASPAVYTGHAGEMMNMQGGSHRGQPMPLSPASPYISGLPNMSPTAHGALSNGTLNTPGLGSTISADSQTVGHTQNGGVPNGGGSDNARKETSNSRYMLRAQAEQSKKADDQTTDLSNSKDRAQMTANTALSLSLIVVLKRLIDEGPSVYKYYYASMTLVILSLILQTTIGLMVLVMHQLQSEAKKNKKKQKSGVQYDASGGFQNLALHYPPGTLSPVSPAGTGSGGMMSPPQGRQMTATLDTGGGVSLRHILESQSEETLLHYYNQLCDDIFNIDNISSSSSSATVSSETQRGVKSKKKELLLVLDNQIKSVRKQRCLAKISKVQNVITYMMYFVFVLNAFLTGFGLA